MSVKHTIDKFVSVDRYYISGLHPHIWKHPEGEMVYFDDYVDLWAEKERLKAEIERLRKAGDAMLGDYRETGIIFPPSQDAWNGDKEGKPSEQKSPSFIEDLGNGVEKHDLLFRYPAKEGKQP